MRKDYSVCPRPTSSPLVTLDMVFFFSDIFSSHYDKEWKVMIIRMHIGDRVYDLEQVR